jgi:hypothetical protein
MSSACDEHCNCEVCRAVLWLEIHIWPKIDPYLIGLRGEFGNPCGYDDDGVCDVSGRGARFGLLPADVLRQLTDEALEGQDRGLSQQLQDGRPPLGEVEVKT